MGYWDHNREGRIDTSAKPKDSYVLKIVTGSIGAESLDFVLPHEHVICDFSQKITTANDVLIDENIQAEELGPLKQYGTGVVVDVTPEGVGRDPEALRRVSQTSEIPIMMGCGWYMEPYYPEWVLQSNTNDLADYLIAQLTDGVNTVYGPIFPGIIGEIGTAQGVISAQEEKVFKAAGIAACKTNTPVTTHAFIYPVGIEQADILLAQGVAPEKIVIGHADTVPFGKYHYELLKRGVLLQFDGCGREHLLPIDRHVKMVAQLCSEGWARQLLLSQDVCMRSDLRGFRGKGYAWLFSNYLKLLQQSGVTSDQISHMIQKNPIELFSIKS